MKIHWIYLVLALVFLTAGTGRAFAAAEADDDPGWPRSIEENGKELTVYQPQIDSWQGYKELHARYAFALREGKSSPEVFGVAEVVADTEVDQETRVVTIIPQSRQLRFPDTTEEKAAALRATVESLLPPRHVMNVSLERVLAYLDPEQQTLQHAVSLDLNPPKIFHSEQPAILVMILGEPQLKPVIQGKADPMFVINTNWDILYDTGGQSYYLLNQPGWLTTKDLLKGPWLPTTSLPADFSTLPQDENWSEVRQYIPGKAEKLATRVFVSTEPAELLLTQGAPTYAPIPGTKLMRINNTEAAIFLHAGEGKYYFLTAGRWFRAPGLDGPWTVASKDLPGDFSLIPDNDPAAFVKASVPGTEDAKDAVLLASVPRTVAMDANTPPQLEVSYDGQPSFQVIPSTTVQYATNTAQSVFLVNGGYYCCDAGAWYSSSSPTGPWTYSTNVPEAIYTIPASHPAHNVTYVTVQSSTPSTVVYAQTAGYSGEYVAATGVLMFGAGMIVGALLNDRHHHYYPAPYSYGWGYRYNYAYGGYYRPPAIGHYYGPYRGGAVATAYNPRTGTYARGASVYGPGGSASRWGAYNPYTGARAAGRRVDTAYGSAGRGAYYNPRTGTAARGGFRSNAQGSVAGVKTNRGTGGVAWDTARGRGAVVKGRSGNVYAGADGKVYRKDKNGNWSMNTGNGWAPVNKQPRAQAKAQAQARPAQKPQTRQVKQERARQVQTPQAARPQNLQRPSVNQPRARPQQVRQPRNDRQFTPRGRDLDSQARARSRGDQLSQNRRRFDSNMRSGQRQERNLRRGGERRR